MELTPIIEQEYDCVSSMMTEIRTTNEELFSCGTTSFDLKDKCHDVINARCSEFHQDSLEFHSKGVSFES